MRNKVRVHAVNAVPYAVAMAVLLMTIGFFNVAYGVTLKTNFDKAAGAYCDTARDFNYYHCLNQVRSCIAHMASIKTSKQYMTEEERAHLILNNCIINNHYRYVEPYTMETVSAE